MYKRARTHTHTLLKQTDSVPIQPDSLHTRLHQYRAILTPTDTLRCRVLSKRWRMACTIATRSPLCLTFLKYSWHSPCSAPCLPPSQALCRISQPWKTATLLSNDSHGWAAKKQKPSGLIGIQEDAALPVSESSCLRGSQCLRGKFECSCSWWIANNFY